MDDEVAIDALHLRYYWERHYLITNLVNELAQVMQR